MKRDGHRHFTGEEPSQKTGLSNPYEGATEHALIMESELRADVSHYRTQAFRMRLRVGTVFREWICDHLRQVRVNGADVVEAIECKPNISFLDADERAVQSAVHAVCTGLGWRHRVVYLRDVLGTGERQINFGEIMAHGTVPVPEDAMAAFERLRDTSRRDATREAPRSDGRSRKPDGPNATAPRPAPSAGPLREDVAQIARRMDLDDDDQPYS